MKQTHRLATGLLFLAMVVQGMPAARAGSQTFLEIEGTVIQDPAQEGVVLLRIDRMFRLMDGMVRVEVRPLAVSCPGDGSPSLTTLAPGQMLALAWETIREPGRSMGRRAKGGQAKLSIPAEGWVVSCGGDVGQRLYGAFVTARGLARELLVAGEQGGFWSRIGVAKGRAAVLPKKVRVRLAWGPDIAASA